MLKTHVSIAAVKPVWDICVWLKERKVGRFLFLRKKCSVTCHRMTRVVFKIRNHPFWTSRVLSSHPSTLTCALCGLCSSLYNITRVIWLLLLPWLLQLLKITCIFQDRTISIRTLWPTSCSRNEIREFLKNPEACMKATENVYRFYRVQSGTNLKGVMRDHNQNFLHMPCFFISPSSHSVLLKHSRYFLHSTRLVLVTCVLGYLR